CQTLPETEPSNKKSKPALINQQLLTKSDDTLVIETATTENLWDAVVSGYGLPTVEQSRLQNHLRWYSNNQQYLDRVVTQGEPYLHYIKKELKKNDLPLEF